MNARTDSTSRLLPAQIGWFGKIPSTGDFVQHNLPHGLLRSWDNWMQNGLAALQQRGPDALARHYAVAPLWNFLLPAGLGQDVVQLGVLAPSCDRVGRYYPVCAIVQFDPQRYDNALLPHCDELYGQLGQALLGAVRHACTVDHLGAQLGAHLDVHLGAALRNAGRPAHPNAGGGAWPELATFFDPLGATGFWWTNGRDGSPLQTTMHTGALNNSLFARLFGPQQGWW